VTYWGCLHEGYDGVTDECPVGTRWTDVWGTILHKAQPGVMAYPCAHPLAPAANLDWYAWPDPDDERICGHIYHQAGRFPDSDASLCGSHWETVWEKAYMLVGMERLMPCFYTHP
jgi:hypothetical protein